ncbi:MAG: hypothetical protein RIB98_11130 [Acidimicrobiales bacterium]
MAFTDQLAPNVAAAFDHLLDGVWDGRVDTGLLESCRQRVCALVGAPDAAGRHRREPVATTDHPATAACLAFTEMWVIDPHAVTDEMAAAVRAHLTDAEAAAFTIALATIEAQARATLAWEGGA